MSVRPVGLLCEYLVDPPAIDEPTPLLSWTFADDDGTAPRGWRQVAHQILVASRPEDLTPAEADRWDSGRIDSGAGTAIPYGGKPLSSRDACWWTMRAWDANGAATPWATPARWTMGLLEPADWHATWIGLEASLEAAEPVAQADGRRVLWPSRLAARHLRREFTVQGPLRRATLYVAGLGCHELWLNEARIGDHIGDPVLTNYDHRVCYVTHDVTAMLDVGLNALGVILGNGRFFAPRSLPSHLPQPRGPNPENWFEEYITRDWGVPRLRLQVELDYADGGHESIGSDEAWRVTDQGPIRANNEYDGEIYDARREFAHWSRPGFDDTDWTQAQRLEGPPGRLVAQMVEPMRVVEVLAPTTIEQPAGRWCVDFGQVIYGRPHIRVHGPPGATVEIRSACDRWPDGRLRVEDNRGARNTDVYILAGSGDEEDWAPAFRGQGFRYMELTGPAEVELRGIRADVLSTDCRPAGTFSCSDPLLNQLESNIRNGHRTFRRSVPMDADRDERQGWMGDHQKHAESDAYHFDVAALYRKWLDDIILEQRPNGQLPELAPAYWPAYDVDLVWPSLAPLLADWLYDCYADLPVIGRVYQPMVRWLAFADTLRRPDGTWDCNNGDWCDTSTVGYTTQRPTGATPRPLIATAYMAHNFRLVARFASLVGDDAGSCRLVARAQEVGEVFNRVFYDRGRGVYGNGTQTSLVLPLAFDLVPDQDRAHVAANLVEDIVVRHRGHLSVGLIGIQWLMQVLTETGYPEVAHLVATQTSFPSWGYMIERGATSTWERWDSDVQGSAMNSAALPILEGNVGAWFFQALAGIALDPTEPAWRRINLRPRPVGALRSASATRDAMGGHIESRWQVRDGHFRWHVAVPPNAVATAWLPTTDAANATADGRPIAEASGILVGAEEPGRLVLTLGSGTYELTAPFAEGAVSIADAASSSRL